MVFDGFLWARKGVSLLTFLNGAHQMFPENTCGLFPTGGSCQLQALRYCHFGILLAFAVAHAGETCLDRTGDLLVPEQRECQ